MARIEWPPALDTPEFRSLWSEWVAHRKRLRKPLTPQAERFQLKKLARDGLGGATARIGRSFEGGWRGLWFRKDPWPPGRAPAEGEDAPTFDPAPALRQMLESGQDLEAARFAEKCGAQDVLRQITRSVHGR